jgi:hypothetical protein
MSKLPPRERVKAYRALARTARAKAAQSKGALQASFIKMADAWEMLAREVEDDDAESGN